MFNIQPDEIRQVVEKALKKFDVIDLRLIRDLLDLPEDLTSNEKERFNNAIRMVLKQFEKEGRLILHTGDSSERWSKNPL